MTQLPVSWIVASLGELVDIFDSRRVPLNAMERASRKGPYPYYGANGQVDSIDGFLFDGNFVLVAEDGGYFDDPSRGVAYKVSGKFWVNNHAHVVRPKEGIDLDYLVFALNAVDWFVYVTGTTRLKLTQAQLQNVEIVLPPTKEQGRIAERLLRLRAHSEAAKLELQNTATKLKSLRQSILAAAFRGDLTADWREKNPDTEPASVLLNRVREERRQRWETAEIAKMQAKGNIAANETWKQRYVEPEALRTSDLPDLPDGWCWAALEEIATIGTGSTPLRSEQRYWTDGSIAWVTSSATNAEEVSEASDYVTSAAVVAHRLRIYPPGTLLVAMYGEGKTRGQVTQLAIPATINQALAAIEVNGRTTLQQVIKLIFMNQYQANRARAAGGVQPNLNLETLKRLAIPLPPEAEQARIVETVQNVLHAVGALERIAKEAMIGLETLRQTILAKAFRGGLVPQDPNDEPATVILERTRKESARRPEPSMRRPRTPRSPKEKSAMAKSRFDHDVFHKPYLAEILAQSGGSLRAQDLFGRADLPVADFYKQLFWEIEQTHVKEAGGELVTTHAN